MIIPLRRSTGRRGTRRGPRTKSPGPAHVTANGTEDGHAPGHCCQILLYCHEKGFK